MRYVFFICLTTLPTPYLNLQRAKWELCLPECLWKTSWENVLRWWLRITFKISSRNFPLCVERTHKILQLWWSVYGWVRAGDLPKILEGQHSSEASNSSAECHLIFRPYWHSAMPVGESWNRPRASSNFLCYSSIIFILPCLSWCYVTSTVDTKLTYNQPISQIRSWSASYYTEMFCLIR
jgi:hypothetical protein